MAQPELVKDIEARVKKSGDTMSNILHINTPDSLGVGLEITPVSNDGEYGQINLNASLSVSNQNGIAIDNNGGTFRIYGIPSKDGTSKVGYGNTLQFDPYATGNSNVSFLLHSENFRQFLDNVYVDKNGSGATGLWNNGSKYAISVPELNAIRTDIKTYLSDNNNIHKSGYYGELNLYRFYADGDEGNYSSSYNLSCVDSHNLTFSIDNNSDWIRVLSLDMRSNDIYTIGKFGGNWSNWYKILNNNNFNQYALPLSGGTLSGPLSISSTTGGPYLTVQYNENWYSADNSRDNYGINLIKFGPPSMDNYLGTSLAGMGTFSGKRSYVYHTTSGCSFAWITSGWTKVMELEANTGNLFTRGLIYNHYPNIWLSDAFLQIGRYDAQIYTDRAVIGVTDGNLHIDPYGNGKDLYLNYYNNGGIIHVGNGGGYYFSTNGSYYNGTAETSNQVYLKWTNNQQGFEDLIGPSNFNFRLFTNWWDSGQTKMPYVFGSGFIMPHADAAYKSYLYFSCTETKVWVGVTTPNNSLTPSWKYLWGQGDSVTGAVWNDYAECREADTIEPGYVLVETGDDSLTKSTERLSPFAGVSSDTWGFSQGETDKAKTPIAVAGRVLVYPWQDRNNYKPGDCVCTAPEGKVDIMTREEVIQYPDRIVGTVSSVPAYDKWGGGENADREPIDVNGRIWIKVR